MPGVKGKGGPPPKRKSQRRRANKPAGGEPKKAAGAVKVVVPKADPEWHPIAVRWFESLALSGQSQFYEPSDWGAAEVLAEAISRELVNEGPVKAAALSAMFSGMSNLLVTEGDRRRARLELERPQSEGSKEVGADVSELSEFRRRARSG